MSRLGARSYLSSDGDAYLGASVILKPASDESVHTVLAADPGAEWGLARSEWLWVRLPNGDLILGIYPQDETCFATEGDHP
jgi:hypothetical protein